MTIYSCPYCGCSDYSRGSKNKGSFTSWEAVNKHVAKCLDNDGSYTINKVYGPIHWTEFCKDKYYLNNKYPYIRNLRHIKKVFTRNGYSLPNLHIIPDNEIIIGYIQKWVKVHKRIPQVRDWYNTEYPKPRQVIDKFGTWNNAIAAAGFAPNIQNGFGIDTYGLDGHLYRSKSEAYFADNFLYGKYTYDIEPKYPSPHNKYYDWYVKELDLYIELDGGLRPHIIAEKIEINKQLHRNCKVCTTQEIYLATFCLVV